MRLRTVPPNEQGWSRRRAMNAPSWSTERIEVTPPSRYTDEWRAMAMTLPALSPAAAMGVEAGDTVLAVGAHPDDETFGMGATLADLASAGVRVHVVAITSGEAALDHLRRRVPSLSERRRDEFQCACAVLGAESSTVLAHPDGGVRLHESELHDLVTARAREIAASHVLANWWGDPHDDHAVVGGAARFAAEQVGCEVSGFPIWAQHWLDPNTLSSRANSVTLMTPTPAGRDARLAAIACYTSQTQPLADDLQPILPPAVVSWDLELQVVP